ncbi:G-I-Y Y-I-G endonuclease [Gordonia phage Ecliptus]|uniref:G-I-Y Y-I-G endonuclease n=2 Tax=Caudoviricetes TaxID=2731619 RepID=A0A345L194_9CAUD|nr:endonuclease [Gordonia phage Apricot]YP_009808426.1 endonuclease [Gordonia phage Phistory]WAB10659.1 G-I-Y Y-I-G endonuclease [Gordonia phage Ecliptus]WNM69794.1 G-I-Y Y-I-G endonuclease [Gordonia phage Crater]AXH49046.1 G-I-Y Y-I-G endonuclease [Gordonia phage Apricot]AXQ64790.1 G-I-Y Y-I-G endonuclease [Gordonia phage Phistory]
MALNKNQRRISNLPHDLYKVYDDTGELLYVGVTVDVKTRLKGHRRYAAWYERVGHIKVWVYPDRMSALDEEARCIAEEHPQHNVTPESRKSEHHRREPEASYALVRVPYMGWCHRELTEVDSA